MDRPTTNDNDDFLSPMRNAPTQGSPSTLAVVAAPAISILPPPTEPDVSTVSSTTIRSTPTGQTGNSSLEVSPLVEACTTAHTVTGAEPLSAAQSNSVDTTLASGIPLQTPSPNVSSVHSDAIVSSTDAPNVHELGSNMNRVSLSTSTQHLHLSRRPVDEIDTKTSLDGDPAHPFLTFDSTNTRFYKYSLGVNGSEDLSLLTGKDLATKQVSTFDEVHSDYDHPQHEEQLVVVQAVYDEHGRAAPLPVQAVQGETTHVPDTAMVPRSESQRPWLIVGFFAVLLLSVVIGSITVMCGNGQCTGGARADPVPASGTPPTDSVAPTVPAVPAVSNLTEQVYEYINNITLTRQTLSSNRTNDTSRTHEQVAVQRLLQINDTPSHQFRWRQRYALASLLAHQESYGSLEGDECDWIGVECQSMDMGAPVGLQNAAVALDLPTSSLNGSLSADLGLLSNLVFVNLTLNSLTGSLPYSIGRWTSMESFSASSNHVNGSLPESIALWTNLVHFDVGPNKLTGSLPASIGTQWSNLRHFNVMINAMNGTLPNNIGEWTKLEHFNVYANVYWTGTLPASIGRWSNLKYFDAGWGRLTGTLPESMGAWTNLEILGLSVNLLTGTLPESIGNWTSIQRALFHRNNFTGAVPTRLCEPTSLLFVTVDKDEVTCECC